MKTRCDRCGRELCRVLDRPADYTERERRRCAEIGLELMEVAISRHYAERANLREALLDALSLAEEGWAYASDYFRDKWNYKERALALASAASDPKGPPDSSPVPQPRVPEWHASAGYMGSIQAGFRDGYWTPPPTWSEVHRILCPACGDKLRAFVDAMCAPSAGGADEG